MPRINWLGWGAGAGVIGLVYHAVISRLVVNEWSRADFDYCYLIPLAMAYLVWERQRELVGTPSRPSWGGLWAFAGAAIFLLLGELGGEYLSLYLSLWWAILGVCWTLLGRAKLRLVLFPIFLLLTAFPPPGYIYSRLTVGMQLLSTKLGVAILHLLGIPAFQDGNVIDMGFTQLEVVAACSGLRFLIPLFIVGMILTYYFRERWWKRAVLMASTLPLAIAMNGVRIGVTGVLVRSYGPVFIEGDAHEAMGWVLFLLSTAILLGLMRLLAGRGAALFAPPASFTTRPALTRAPRAALIPLLVGLSLVAGAAGYLRYRAATPDVLPQARAMSGFPLSFAGWSGRFVSMDQKFIDELDFTDYAQIDFHDAKGRAVDFYVAWYQSQSKGESIHSPETCLRGGGWQFESSEAIDLALPGSRTVRVNRTLLEQNGQRMISYFWFPARGRYLTNGVELKLYTFWDSLTTRRTDGALVRCIAPIYAGESESDAEARLVDLLRQAVPVLEEMLPGA